MRKKRYTLFLLLVMAIQMLPVQQIGRALFGNVFTEEIPHGMDWEKDMTAKKDIRYAHDFDWDLLSPATLVLKHILNPLHTQNIPQHPAVDIHVPPPNC
ncbi:MAG TPA: hypothetical protein VG842_12740 [Sediminibacterium sp.]|nr:hypothetical protein [Sediminibacterium sp.]